MDKVSGKVNLGYLYLLNTVILFSTYEVVSKTLAGKVGPLQINFIRFLAGGFFLFLFLVIKKDMKVKLKDFCLLILAGLINVVASMSLIQLAIFVPGAKVSMIAVIFSSNPIFVFLFSVLLDKEKVKLYKLIGLLIGFFGIITVFIHKLSFDASNLKSPILALLSAISYALYTVIARRASNRVGSLKMNAYSFIAGSILLLPILLLLKQPVFTFDISGIYQMAYLSFLVTGAAYLMYFMGLVKLGASKGSMVFFIKPVLASAIAIIFLKESPSMNMFVGTALIIAGILIVLYWEVFKERFVDIYKKLCNNEKYGRIN